MSITPNGETVTVHEGTPIAKPVMDAAVAASNNPRSQAVDVLLAAYQAKQKLGSQQQATVEEPVQAEQKPVEQPVEQATEVPATNEAEVTEVAEAQEDASVENSVETDLEPVATEQEQDTQQELEPETTDANKQPNKKLLKQIDKRTREYRLAQAENEQLKNRLAELERKVNEAPKQVEKRDFGAYNKATDVAQLKNELNDLRSAKITLENALYGKDKVDENGNEYLLIVDNRKVSRDEAIRWKSDIDRKVMNDLPSRIQLLEQVSEQKRVADNNAANRIAWLKDNSSPIRRELEQMKQDPNYGHLFAEVPHLEALIAGGLEWWSKNNQQPQQQAQVKKPAVIAKPKTVPAPVIARSGPAPEVGLNKESAKQQYENMKADLKNVSHRDMTDALAKLSAFKRQHKL